MEYQSYSSSQKDSPFTQAKKSYEWWISKSHTNVCGLFKNDKTCFSHISDVSLLAEWSI